MGNGIIRCKDTSISTYAWDAAVTMCLVANGPKCVYMHGVEGCSKAVCSAMLSMHSKSVFCTPYCFTWSKAVPERSCKMKARSTIGSTESHAVCMQAFDVSCPVAV